ncbi:MAG: polyamine ABC transporter ATP-binding protein [Planctomycetota bacterium]|nr:MAG: polyamine ABC transporter ATP-binding protein [Planctomycetota bacterium]
MALIEARDVEIGFGGPPILSGVNVDIEAGEIFAILGGSGCGKSTLLRHLIGLQAPQAGTIRVQGEDPAVARQDAPPFGVMFQSGALFGSLTLTQNVALPLEEWSTLDADSIATVAAARLALVGLDGFENHLPAEISGGMKKRAGIARALALEPDILFLDEPSAGLDPVTSVELDELLLKLNANLGVTIVLVTHELDSLFKIAKRCVMLDRDAAGAIASGDPRALRDDSTDHRVHRFFNRQSSGAAPA